MTAGSAAPHVPDFELQHLIGEGGFGQVWQARDSTGTRVAIKVLHFELVQSTDAMVRFQRELAAIERLRHPNVVRGLAHGTLDDGRPYIVLEYLEGPSLRELVRERGAVPPTEMLAIFGPLCVALDVAHAAGLVHRDLKASNVIVTPDRGPVLLDFGLVKLLDQSGPGLTSSRNMLGTPTAMAPEQMRGQAVDARTDVYALGLLAFHMLTGQPAFGGGVGAIKSYLQLHGPRPRPSSKVDIDPAIDAPIVRALAPDPADRFATARDLFDALRAVIHPRKGPSAPEPPPPMEQPATGRAPTPARGVDLDVVVLYIEADRLGVTRAGEIARAFGMTIAITAPDSLLAVIPRELCDRPRLREAVHAISTSGRVALGCSRASIRDDVVDGPALDVETWAPYPLAPGLWIAPEL